MFVIYDTRSTMQVGPVNGHPHSLYAKSYKTRGAARRTCAMFNSEHQGYGPGPYGFCSEEHYHSRVVRMVERVNLMSGKTFMEPSNTPGFCSPSSEAYWSM